MQMTQHHDIALSYRLYLEGSLHVSSGTGITGLLDNAIYRTASNEISIPGSSIKGKLRHHVEQLVRICKIPFCGHSRQKSFCKPKTQEDEKNSTCIICRLFGSPWQEAGLFYSDAQLSTELQKFISQNEEINSQNSTFLPNSDFQTSIRSRIRLDRKFGQCEQGALFSFEEADRNLFFNGTITGSLLSKTIETGSMPLEVLALLMAIKLCTSIGGKQTIGLGRCKIQLTGLTLDGENKTDKELKNISNEFENLFFYNDEK